MFKRLSLFLAHQQLRVLHLIGLLLIAGCNGKAQNDMEKTFQLFNSPKGCYACQFFKIVYNTGAEISSKAYNSLCDMATSLLIIGLLIWLVWHFISTFVTLREPNISKYWIELFQHFFKAGFVAILIRSKEHLIEFINSILTPISLIIIDLSQKLLASNWSSSINPATLSSSYQSGPGFSAQIGGSLENLIYRITVALNLGFVMGLRLMLQTDLINFWLGVVTTAMFFLMIIIFPFYLIDGFIRLALVFTMLPIFLVAWVFKWSSHYMKKAFAMFLGAFLQVMIACIFVSICIAVFEGFVAIRGFGYLLDPTVQNIDRLFNEEANRMSFSFLSFLMLAFYMYNLSKNVPKLASTFTGAPSGNVLARAIERTKKAARALALTAAAIATAMVGLPAVSKVAAEQAKKDAEGALKGK